MSEKDYLWLHLRDLPYFRAMLRAVEAQFYQEFELPAPTLDVGCGDGHFATIAFDRRWMWASTRGADRSARQPAWAATAAWCRRMAGGRPSRMATLPAR